MQLETVQLNDHIGYLDNGLLDVVGMGSTYVVRGEEIAIIETGTAGCVPHVLDGLRHLQIDPAAVRHVLLTHIHLDHAGGTGTLLPALPQATVYIHSRTACYLVDPTKLLSSAERALGALFPLHLPVEPVPEARIAHADDLRLDLGRGVVLQAVPTPGHSPDHLSYYEVSSRVLFTGDAIGISVPAWRYLGPVTPPPAFDFAAQRATFDKLLALDIDTLLFSHYGPGMEPPRTTIEKLRARYEQLVALVQVGWEAGHVDHQAILRAMYDVESVDTQGEAVIVGWVEMNINGLVHAFERQARQS